MSKYAHLVLAVSLASFATGCAEQKGKKKDDKKEDKANDKKKEAKQE